MQGETDDRRIGGDAEWRISGKIPCMHAISAIQYKNDKRVEEYCYEWLKIEVYRRTYCFNVNPVKGQDL
ncbi:hypothetical protein Ahy_A01g000432 [Arachis hypogaea]|uniref:Zinc finger PMZ-type domain-containing protein n=1 Tax=Arachis hypogaea TaxID=3818 RepID=A0A445EK54_ARAHY|nr:hypothetical protein Ahy_A01g000432 [Arachis hypogaea]